jgi:hypothetical protein
MRLVKEFTALQKPGNNHLRFPYFGLKNNDLKRIVVFGLRIEHLFVKIELLEVKK